MGRILVVGATGNIGREVVSLTRNPAAVHLLPEVEVAQGDVTAPETLEQCLDRIDAVFMVWTAPAAAFAPALERIAKRARRLVYLSAPLKTPHPFFQQPNPSRVAAENIERLIEASGLEWTFLRPGMFALNSRIWWAQQIRDGGVVGGLISPFRLRRFTSTTSPPSPCAC